MIGQTISHYKILEKLGEGGMGEVYLAEDTELDRKVALKFLSSSAIAGEDEKKRFKREAKAAAALNHPNIAYIHAINEVDGQMFLAMEFIEGKTLDELTASPLPLDKAIDYATQISAGHQAAHEKGIVHRDIKSANIMVTDKGVAKIMDFGLAKLQNRSKMTRLGTTLGTAAYMSPEQARGDEADNRSDIWSLGVVLYEMISGQLPFKGDYEQAVIYSIQNEEPEPLTALRSGVPIALDGVIAKALAKEADTRYQHVDELPADLKGIELSVSQVSRIAPATTSAGMELKSKPSRGYVSWTVTALVALLAASVASFLVWSFMREPNVKQVTARWETKLPAGTSLEPGVAISPDGKLIVYSGRTAEDTKLYLRSLEEFKTVPVKGTDSAQNPFFSPDGQWLGFVVQDKLMKVALAGGRPVYLCEVQGWTSAYWASDGAIYFQQRYGAGISKVSESGGTPEAVTQLDHSLGERQHSLPVVLPGGKWLLYTIRSGIESGAQHIAVQSLETGERKVLVAGGVPHYLATGQLVYESAYTLMAVRFDLARMQIVGTPVVVLDQLDWDYAISSTGTVLYSPNTSPTVHDVHQLVWVDLEGKETPILDTNRPYHIPKLSPDGKQLAVSIFDGSSHDIWTLELERPVLNRVTFEGSNASANWTPDQQHLTITSDVLGPIEVFSKPMDAPGSIEKLVSGEYHL